MASVRAVLITVLAAAAVECVVGGGFEIPGLFGSSLGVSTTAPSSSIGGSVSVEAGGVTIPIQLGPVGGIQARIVGPVLPSLNGIIKATQEGLNTFGGFGSAIINQAGNVAKAIGDNIQNALSLAGIQIGKLVSGAGGVFNAAINAGKLGIKQANEVASSIFKAALSNSISTISVLIDLLDKGIEKKILLEEQAISLLVSAVKDGVHKIENASDWSLKTFLDNAAKARTISKDVADKLKDLIQNPLKGTEAISDIVNSAVQAGQITAAQASEIASSISKAAVSKSTNPISDVIDLIKEGIKKKILLDKQAVNLLALAVKNGVQKIENASDWSLESFLNSAAKAETITDEVAEQLKTLAKSKTDSDKDSSEETSDDKSETKSEVKTEVKAEVNAETES